MHYWYHTYGTMGSVMINLFLSLNIVMFSHETIGHACSSAVFFLMYLAILWSSMK